MYRIRKYIIFFEILVCIVGLCPDFVYADTATSAPSSNPVSATDFDSDTIRKCVTGLEDAGFSSSSWTKSQKEEQAKVFCMVMASLLADGFTSEAACGVLCNMKHESRLDPYLGENNYAYFKNNGSSNYTLSAEGNGIGLCQWSFGRRVNFSKFCKDKAGAVKLTQTYTPDRTSNEKATETYVASAPNQIAFLIKEKTWYNNESDLALEKLSFDKYKTLKDATLATKYFCLCWEAPSNRAATAVARAKSADDVMKLINSGIDFGKGVSSSDAQTVADDLVKSGLWDESKFVTFCNLVEKTLSFPSRDNLSREQLKGINDWKNNIENTTESSIIMGIRIAVMLIGIVFLVWVILVYIAYWFDRINNILDFEVLPIVTFDRLHVAPEEHECNFNPKNVKKGATQTVNHKVILGICFTGLFLGVAIVTGKFYTLLNSLIRWALNLVGVM